jgi:hypothetical protein
MRTSSSSPRSTRNLDNASLTAGCDRWRVAADRETEVVSRRLRRMGSRFRFTLRKDICSCSCMGDQPTPAGATRREHSGHAVPAKHWSSGRRRYRGPHRLLVQSATGRCWMPRSTPREPHGLSFGRAEQSPALCGRAYQSSPVLPKPRSLGPISRDQTVLERRTQRLGHKAGAERCRGARCRRINLNEVRGGEAPAGTSVPANHRVSAAMCSRIS